MKAKFVELHLLQNFPPSCINRDGNNSPKDCQFGGVRRARISSQSLKRAIRTSEEFEKRVGRADRTKLNLARAMATMQKEGVADSELEAKATEMVTKLSKMDTADKDKSPEKKRTAVLLFFGDDEWGAMVRAYLAGDSKWIEAAKPKSADILLFGRMLAESPALNIDAACQVAHAISTNKAANEFDFWSAVDDLQAGEDPGAGMLGAAEFNSACFYRYSCVSLNQLATSFGNEEMAKKAVEAFLVASYYAIPTGKQNAFAHFTPPDFAMVVVREQGAPLNLVNAFESPVRPKEGVGLTEASAGALQTHYGLKTKMIGDGGVFVAHCHALPGNFEAFGQRETSVDALVQAALEKL